MGIVHVRTEGSFRKKATSRFSAMSYGHAEAVIDAITYLQTTVLPDAIQQDVELAKEGSLPQNGFGPTVTEVLHNMKK